MAENDSTRTDKDERRKGARAALAALQKLEDAVSQYNGETFLAVDPGVSAGILIEGTGEKLSPKAEGYLAVLSEYLAAAMEAGIPDLNSFTPLAAMNEAQEIVERQRWAKAMGCH